MSVGQRNLETGLVKYVQFVLKKAFPLIHFGQ